MKKFLMGTAALLVVGVCVPRNRGRSSGALHQSSSPGSGLDLRLVRLLYGGNGGWGTNRDCRSNVTAALFLGCFDATGGVAGGQIGYRWQTGGWVFGLEAQGDGPIGSGSTQNLGNINNHIHSQLDGFGLFTGQIGYAWNSVLLYAKGGAAVTSRNFDFVNNTTNLVAASFHDNNRWSPTVGVGLEFGFAPNWSAAIEYDHISRAPVTSDLLIRLVCLLLQLTIRVATPT